MRNITSESFFKKYNPAIPRQFLFLIAGVIWTGVGVLLCGRAIVWLMALSPVVGITLVAAGLLIAGTGYYYGFFKVVKKNMDRIANLPERVCMFAFTAWRGYFMIGLMVTLGITLRNSPLPKVYLVLPYLTMGAVLLIGSFSFYRRFAASLHDISPR